MTDHEIELTTLIRESTDPATAITVALKVVLAFSEPCERDQSHDPFDLPGPA